MLGYVKEALQMMVPLGMLSVSLNTMDLPFDGAPFR